MKFLKYILLFFAAFTMSSCLEGGLDELPAYEDADVKWVKFEHRWMVQEGESQKLRVKTMNTAADIDLEACTVTCRITVPQAGGEFTASERSKVSLNNIVAFYQISTAAVMKPVGNAPKPGTIADYSAKEFQYEITAADGKTKKLWTLKIVEFNK